ncbi:hypothetical protein TELCIR_11640 [Teladorsagia circumcincta]|uniref:Uncharacterized protein n=1 Tax=Teladorsagia circumcincta TaxID=45464 RepID=A0A2G9UAW0_TELCI|nr:hypothetical protein TELCIR_11640 [Teladorsagia circumcincta]
MKEGRVYDSSERDTSNKHNDVVKSVYETASMACCVILKDGPENETEKIEKKEEITRAVSICLQGSLQGGDCENVHQKLLRVTYL